MEKDCCIGKNLEIISLIIMILFALSTTISFIAQSSFISKIENVLYREGYFNSDQEEWNTLIILQSLCGMDKKNSTSCYEYNQKAKSIGNHYEQWNKDQKEYYKNSQEDFKKYKNKNLFSLIFFSWVFF